MKSKSQRYVSRVFEDDPTNKNNLESKKCVAVRDMAVVDHAFLRISQQQKKESGRQKKECGGGN